jgi:hypothetical protein
MKSTTTDRILVGIAVMFAAPVAVTVCVFIGWGYWELLGAFGMDDTFFRGSFASMLVLASLFGAFAAGEVGVGRRDKESDAREEEGR